MILAHGFGGRSDLPVPVELAASAAVGAVLVSFVALTVLWKRPRLRGARAGVPVPLPVQRAVDARPTRALLGTVGLLLLGAQLAVCWWGSPDPAHNPGAAWFYVWFWVGLVPLSILAGPVWRLLNPLRTLAAALRLLLPAGGAWSRPLPPRLGALPAIAGLAAFLWLELVYPASDSPRAIAVFLTGYVLVHAAAGAMYGPRWFDAGEAFELYSTLLAALSPFGRRADGRFVVRNPLDGLLTLVPAPFLTGFVLLTLGATMFDGITRWPIWNILVELLGPLAVLAGTVGLAASVGVVSWAYRDAVRLTGRYLRHDPERTNDGYAAFVHSLIPIMFGYTVAHYFSFAVFEGQTGWIRASDPFGLEWDLFGTAQSVVDYTIVGPLAIAVVQVAGIVLGHVLAVISAHDRAVAVLRPDATTVGQYPMLTLTVAYTFVGVALVSLV